MDLKCHWDHSPPQSPVCPWINLLTSGKGQGSVHTHVWKQPQARCNIFRLVDLNTASSHSSLRCLLTSGLTPLRVIQYSTEHGLNNNLCSSALFCNDLVLSYVLLRVNVNSRLITLSLWGTEHHARQPMWADFHGFVYC